jgi:hypothetical protein
MRRLIAFTIVAVLGLTGVASAKILVSYQREGGFRGVPLSLTVGTGGKARAVEGFDGPTETEKLSDKELRGLKRLLRRADFPNLEQSYLPKPGTVSDGYTETVTYKGYSITSGTGGTAPERLNKLLLRLAEIATEAGQ